MRTVFAALALAGALIPLDPERAPAADHVAQMSRDVIDAIRRQRGHPPERMRKRRDCKTDEGRR